MEMKTSIEMLERVISFSWVQGFRKEQSIGERRQRKGHCLLRAMPFWRFRYGKRTSYWSGTISGTGTDLIPGFPPQASGW